MNIYKVNEGRFDLVKSQNLPTTGCLGSVYVSSSKDEIFGTAVNGYLWLYQAMNSYQFDRTTEELVFKSRLDTIPDNVWFLDSANDGNRIVTVQSTTIMSIARQPSGGYQVVSRFTKPEWRHSDGALAVRVT